MSSDTNPEKRAPIMVYLRPSIKRQIDVQRVRLEQSRSEWLERAAKAWLKASKGEK